MPTRLAYAIAQHWARSRKHPPPAVLREDIAQQVQRHLDHGASADYLRRICWWMAVEQPAWFDLDLAMRMSGAPQPEQTAAPTTRQPRCPCRAQLAAA